MHKCSCGEPVNPKRWALGFFSCLECGDKRAAKEIERKANNVAPMHKSNYIYLGDNARETILDISNMRRSDNAG